MRAAEVLFDDDYLVGDGEGGIFTPWDLERWQTQSQHFGGGQRPPRLIMSGSAVAFF